MQIGMVCGLSEGQTRKRSLSGIQPSGETHIGNYFGAIRQYVELQETHDCFYFLADYHALTSLQDRELLEQYTLSLATDLLALGLDPERSTIFLQSDVPEVTELTWILSCVTPMGLLERCHAYKDKIGEGLSPSHGLFAYPVLMASDILIYDSDVVPVGQDQKQHLEVTRDIAQRFNNRFGEVFVLPEAYILPDVATVPGLDGRKMSKSYGNTIGVFEDPESIRRKVMRIVTDSTPVEAPKDPEKCNVFQLYRLVAPAAELEAMERRYREGGVGYGEVKQETVGLLLQVFGPARERRAELAARPELVKAVLAEGGAKARAKAREVLNRAREACGYRAR